MSVPELILFDTDMGTDDAWALFMLLKAEKKYNLKTVGITVVHGNTDVENGIKNALRVLSAADRLDIPVYKGATEPMVRDFEKNWYHGKNGFGDCEFPTEPDVNLVSSENAINFMYRVVKEHPKQVTIIGVGPLTNIALAMKTYSDFSDLVKDIFIMGGNYNAVGNCKSECAEFNFFADPDAAYVVLNNSKCTLTILPWEACMETNLDISMDFRFNDIGLIESNVTNLMNLVDEAIYKPKDRTFWNPCDALLIAVLLEKDKAITKSTKCFASVELNGGLTRGQVVIYHMTGLQRQFNVTLVELVDSNVCKNLLLWTVQSECETT